MLGGIEVCWVGGGLELGSEALVGGCAKPRSARVVGYYVSMADV